MTVHSKTAAALDAAKAAGRTGLVAFLPAGYPSVDECVEAVVAAADNGADVIELGLPYTDPVMDGPVIQAATQAALQAGFHVADVFDIIRRVTQRTDAAVLVMTYWNLVDRMGVDEFARRLAEAGGAGLVTPDLVPEEAGAWMEAADRHGLDRKLLHALVVVESAYRVEACSPAGACGLTQLMPGTAADLGVADRFDPLENLRGGADYLARQIVRFGDLRLALAAYNSGPGRVARLGRIPDITETRNYVVAVVDCYLALTAGRGVRSSRECGSAEGGR